jgi:phosphoglycerate dehydrogenase-like enzyme
VTPFRVALTGDFYDAHNRLCYPDIGLDALANDPCVELGRFAEHHPEIDPAQLAGFHGVVVLTPRVTARSVSEAKDLIAVGRFGVGYDAVDVPACTAADVALLIAVGAVDHSVAEATVGWMLALSLHVRTKDRIVREGRWHERNHFMGCELRGRTLGLVGFGGIGREVVRVLAGFGMNTPLVFDPFLSPDRIAALGARPSSLDELLANADFVSLHCPLSDTTRNLIGPRQLALMKPTAYLINTARGGIVDEEALFDTLANHRIAGAAIDCFRDEPLLTRPKFADLDNVLLAPHAIAWTGELFRDIVELAHGRKPVGVVNPVVFDKPSFHEKWKRIRHPS